MQLAHLTVRLETYGLNAGKYVGEIGFKNEYGTVTVVLDDTLSVKVLQLCGDALVEQAKKTSVLMTASILENTIKALPEA